MNDEVIAAGAQKVAYGGGAASLYGGMTANEIAAFGGLLIALLGLLVQGGDLWVLTRETLEWLKVEAKKPAAKPRPFKTVQ
jgi:hypothetical protein